MSLQTNVTDLATRVATEFKTLRTSLTGNNAGALTGLTTTDKTSLIGAINELDDAIEALAGAEGGATIVDGVPSTASVWSSSKTDTEIDSAISAAIAVLVDTAPGTLDTLNELAAALGDDPNFATTITNSLAGKAATVHTHTASQVTDFNTAADARVNALVPSASASVAGKVELATDTEATTGTDTSRAITPANLTAVVGNSATNFVTTFEAGLV